LKSKMSFYTMVGFLDSMFPVMKGLNLIAFVLQMNDEVNQSKKTLELAKNSFASTLKSRGTTVTKDKVEEKATEIALAKVKTGKTKEISTKLKKQNLNRLTKLMKSRKKHTLYAPGKLQIKDVFDKGPSKEEIEPRKADIKKAEEEAKKAVELAQRLSEKEEEIKEEEAQRATEKAAKLKATEEKIKQEEERARLEEEAAQKAQEAKMASQDDDDIESRIAAFESDLAMPFPLFNQGEIASETTEKGKKYFCCTTDDCWFVSWDKPYHFDCPLCKNSFLTETALPTDEKELKYLRPACPHSQNNLFDPVQNMAQIAENEAPKKKIVRRKKRR
jgi:hypothetical protein